LCSLFVDKIFGKNAEILLLGLTFLVTATLLLMTYVSKSSIYNLLHVLLHFLGRIFLQTSHAHATVPTY
jgi:hypothetical protein